MGTKQCRGQHRPGGIEDLMHAVPLTGAAQRAMARKSGLDFAGDNLRQDF